MIRFENVTKSFGENKVLDDLSFEIEKDKVTFIIGRSGGGKSVTIKHIIGLLKPDAGEIFIDNQCITSIDKHAISTYRRKIGMLFQHSALFDSMTVGENVLFPLQEHTSLSLPVMLKRVEEVLTQVGLPNIQHRYPAELSTGEKKRVGLARALATKPLVMLYDEPTTGMDPLIAEMIDELITKVNKESDNMTSIVISHDLKAALASADQIIFLYKGKVAMQGKPEEFRKTKDPLVRQFFSGRVEGPMEFT